MDENFLQALKIISGKIQNIKWHLIGSTNLTLQGMNFSPNDLDIIVQLKDLKKVSQIFKEFLVSDIKELKSLISNKVWEIKLSINEVEVQILAEEEGLYVKDLIDNKTKYISINGFIIPCRTLESEVEAYNKLNRKEKSELIKDFLKSKNKQSKERVLIFIDGSNLYHSLRRLNIKKINFEKLIDLLKEDGILISVFYYNAPLDISIDSDKYWQQQKFFDYLRELPKFKVTLCRLRKHKTKEGEYWFDVKGDDVCLTVDLISGAYENLYDTAIIVTGDEDFVPAIKKVQKLGKKVKDAYFTSSSSDYLRQSCDSSICLNKYIPEITKIQDKKDPVLPEDHTGEDINNR